MFAEPVQTLSETKGKGSRPDARYPRDQIFPVVDAVHSGLRSQAEPAPVRGEVTNCCRLTDRQVYFLLTEIRSRRLKASQGPLLNHLNPFN